MGPVHDGYTVVFFVVARLGQRVVTKGLQRVLEVGQRGGSSQGLRAVRVMAPLVRVVAWVSERVMPRSHDVVARIRAVVVSE